MDIKWKKELSLTERISWDRKKREDWCKNQQSRDTWGGGSKTFVYNCSRIEKNFFLSSFSFLSFNKLDSESAAKQMKFNYNLGGITQRRRGEGGRFSKVWSSLESVGANKGGEEERGGRNFRRWNGKWSVTAELEIQIRMPSRSTSFERSLANLPRSKEYSKGWEGFFFLENRLPFLVDPLSFELR